MDAAYSLGWGDQVSLLSSTGSCKHSPLQSSTQSAAALILFDVAEAEACIATNMIGDGVMANCTYGPLSSGQLSRIQQAVSVYMIVDHLRCLRDDYSSERVAVYC